MDKRDRNRRSAADNLKSAGKLLGSNVRTTFDIYNIDSNEFGYIKTVVELLMSLSRDASNQHKLLSVASLGCNKSNQNNDNTKPFDLLLEYKITDKNGHHGWYRDRIHAISDGEGRIASIVRYVMPSKQYGTQFLQDKVNHLMHHHTPFAFFKARFSDGKILDCNEYFWRLFDFNSKDECVAASCLGDYYPNKTWQLMLERIETRGRIEKLPTQIQISKGRTIWIETSAKYFQKQGNIEGIFRDISLYKALSTCERKVLKLVLEGKCNRDIALLLHRSVRTIEDHRAHLMQKLGVHNLVELVQKAGTVEFGTLAGS